MLRGQEEDEEGEERSPNKRHRTTPRPHNIPRPSLDFEKMQQVNFLNWINFLFMNQEKPWFGYSSKLYKICVLNI